MSAPTPFYAETLADISFEFGRSWARLSDAVRKQIMDDIGGPRALIRLALEWADEFQENDRPDEENYDYEKIVAEFSTTRFNGFVSDMIRERLSK